MSASILNIPPPNNAIPIQDNNLIPTDQNGRRIAMLGSIDGKQGILVAERTAFATESLEALRAFHAAIARVNNLGDNDIYRWYLASSGTDNGAQSQPDLKLNIIWPCTEQHIKKYSDQILRMVTETPDIYTQYIRPYMSAKREEGRLNWVFNILEGRTEQEDVILRDAGHGREDAFLMLPDLNWDRKTMGSLHLLALVQRRDIWSLRDLKKKHIPWLQYLRRRVLEATVNMYPDLEQDQLKLYVHCKFWSLVGLALRDADRQQTNRPITIFTSMLSMLCSRRGPRKRLGRLLGWRISSPSWRPYLAMTVLVWRMSV